jgi:hypothetical protein
VFLKGYRDGREAARKIGEWFARRLVRREAIVDDKVEDMMTKLPRCPHALNRNSRRSLSLRDRKERRAVGLPN